MQLVKRIVPFVLTLALGLFIASFFVTLTFPKIRKFERRYEYRHECRHSCRMHRKIERQREQEREWQRKLDELKLDSEMNVTKVPPVAPMPVKPGDVQIR